MVVHGLLARVVPPLCCWSRDIRGVALVASLGALLVVAVPNSGIASAATIGPQITQQALVGAYKVVLYIGPNEKMYTQAQYHKLHPKTGEIMLSGTMATMNSMGGTSMGNSSMNAKLKPHHLEVHIYIAHSGAVVTTAQVSISLTDLHTKMTTMIPVATMEGIGEGVRDFHYGNMVMLMTEHYRVTVTFNGLTHSFTVPWNETAPAMSM